jgi:hypothetical protein
MTVLWDEVNRSRPVSALQSAQRHRTDEDSPVGFGPGSLCWPGA